MSITIVNHETQESIYVRDAITASVITDLARRAEIGYKKYGTTLEDNNTDDFDNHLYEELLDAAQYTKKRMKQNKGNNDLDKHQYY